MKWIFPLSTLSFSTISSIDSSDWIRLLCAVLGLISGYLINRSRQPRS
jgi:hypothetical protein